MRKFLLYSSALMVFGFSDTVLAACIQTPNCTSLGYTSATACEGGLKCPWGNAWFCNVGGGDGGGSSKPDYSNCKIGDILYSDMTCNTNVVASKTPIGVIFDVTNRLAVGLEHDVGRWSYPSFDIPGLSNISFSSPSKAIADWQGKKNTQIALEYCQTNGKTCAPFEYVNSYKTEGINAGDWYLPALGELNAIYDNKSVLDIALGKVGGDEDFGSRTYWSSTEQGESSAWELNFTNGAVGENTSKTTKIYFVLPVLAF